MKKTLTLLSLLSFLSMGLIAQNLISGGSMEAADETSWSVSTLETDPSNTSSYEFDYTDNTPFAGNGACLHYVITNTGANGAHLMFYQLVTLEKGKKYIADMAAKAIQEMNNSWFEVYLGANEPVEGSDYGPGTTALGGFKWSGWEAGCAGLDLFDGTLRNDGCMAHSQDTIFIEGEGTVDMYFGFKAGIWGTATTVEFVVDNVSLVEAGTSAVDESLSHTVSAYPNPANNTVHITGSNIIAASIFNLLGQEVSNPSIINNTIDISALSNGIYLMKLLDANQQQSVIRIQKN